MTDKDQRVTESVRKSEREVSSTMRLLEELNAIESKMKEGKKKKGEKKNGLP